ncbi:potassium channel family protein [Pseudanabaena yagii]|uniref:Potassium channel protein n=1 Tax=Pseudanabaena yagii GIHE-NHR1 TaxID=2722753 RepID=A0ABX1LU08_9CYAN|nr:potassium channel protein [Pseudanabaena yagii]NMF57387.1 potassium channel protein [Pseudanabaena yagii GIHE-NHR1]
MIPKSSLNYQQLQPIVLQRELLQYQRTLLVNVGILVSLVIIGTLGYHLIEGWSWFDSLYMTIITLATIGYGETNPLHLEGRIFTMTLIVMGVISISYIAAQFTTAIANGHIYNIFQARRQRKVMESLDKHYIVCGFGRTGRQVTAEFAAEGSIPFVVIDSDPVTIEQAEQEGYPALQGDAALDNTLLLAGVERAICIVAALPSDAENLYTVLSAKTLNPDIRAIARASTEESMKKLRRGGADEVISPYITGGKRMAAVALRPQVMDFVDGIIAGSNRSFYIEEYRIDEPSYIGMSLKKASLRSQTGALVLAIRRADGDVIAGPDGNTEILQGDVLISMGTPEQLRALNQILSPLSKKPNILRLPRTKEA